MLIWSVINKNKTQQISPSLSPPLPLSQQTYTIGVPMPYPKHTIVPGVFLSYQVCILPYQGHTHTVKYQVVKYAYAIVYGFPMLQRRRSIHDLKTTQDTTLN